MSWLHTPDQLGVAFDDRHAVAAAGLVLPATLSRRLGSEGLVDALVDLGDRPGAHRPGRKVATLVHAMTAGADCIDDTDRLRLPGPLSCLATGSWPPPGSHRARSPLATSVSSTGSPKGS